MSEADRERFAAAKRAPIYRETIAEGPPPGMSIAGSVLRLIVAGILLAGLAIVTIAMKQWWLAIFSAVMWLAMIVMVVRQRRAKVSMLLAIVAGEGATATGEAYGGPSGMSHFLILRFEDGTERTLRANAMAAAGLSKGDIGVVALKGDYVEQFTQITLPASAA